MLELDDAAAVAQSGRVVGIRLLLLLVEQIVPIPQSSRSRPV